MRAVVIYNPKSGSSLPLRELKKKFKQAGVSIEKVLDVTDNVSRHLKPWLQQDKVIIAAIGGDGTLSSVAGLLAGTKAIFAPLPGGTLNHFTKDLGISQDLDEAIANLVSSKPRKIDVASVNDIVFINNSSMGLYPSSLQVRDKLEQGWLSKWPAAVIGSLKALIRYRTYTVTINQETFKTPFVFVGNNDYHLDDPSVNGRSRLNSGHLCVYAVASASRWSLIKILASSLIGRVKSIDDIKIWKPTSLTIKTKRSRVHISRDGEYEKVTTPLTYKILASGLNIIGN